MSKAIKCDRCDKFTDNFPAYAMINGDHYIGKIGRHTIYVDSAEYSEVDLCPSCQYELDDIVRNFMENKL